MDGFWSAFYQAIINRAVWVWGVVGFLSGAIGLVLDFALWRKPKWENKLRWLRAVPFIVFGVLLFIVLVFLMPYNIWLNEQNNMQNEIQKNIELQKQLSSITKLEIISLPIKNQRVNSPNIAEIDVTFTPDFRPEYYSVIPKEFRNRDPNNHIFEIIWIKLSPMEFKFTYIDTQKLPSNCTILDGYIGTNYATLVINDYAPLEANIIDFPVYTMTKDNSIWGTEKLEMVSLDNRTLP